MKVRKEWADKLKTLRKKITVRLKLHSSNTTCQEWGQNEDSSNLKKKKELLREEYTTNRKILLKCIILEENVIPQKEYLYWYRKKLGVKQIIMLKYVVDASRELISLVF